MKELPRFVLYSPTLNPCTVEGPNVISYLNVGGASKGILIIFSGNGIENDDVVISNGFLQTKNTTSAAEPDVPPFHLASFDLKKVNHSGEWVWEGMIPDFEIPEKVPDNLGPKKTDDESWARCFSIRFDVSGDKRKFLDIQYLEERIRDAQEAEALWGIKSPTINLDDFDLSETMPRCQKPRWY